MDCNRYSIFNSKDKLSERFEREEKIETIKIVEEKFNKTYNELNEIEIIKLIFDNSDLKDNIHIKNRVNAIIYKINNNIINQFN